MPCRPLLRTLVCLNALKGGSASTQAKRCLAVALQGVDANTLLSV